MGGCGSTSGSYSAGGGAIGITPAAVTYSLGGAVTGLAAGDSVVLQNGADRLTVSANGAFSFPTPVSTGTEYFVSVATAPAAMNCMVNEPTGTVQAANVTTVDVHCSPNVNARFSLSGTTVGLAAASSVVLVNSVSGESLTITGSGSFAFTTTIPYDGSYSVTIATQPAGQVCSVGAGVGSGVTADVTNVMVTCSTDTFTVSGSVSGLGTGQQLTLLDDNADPTVLTANGAFSFSTPIPYGGSYAVTVASQPVGATCSVAQGVGSAVAANVSTIQITCSAETFTVSGTVSGLAATRQLTLQNNASNPTTVTSNGAFTFSVPVPYEGAYVVTISAPPTGETCAVTNGAATGVTANVTNVQVTCVTSTASLVSIAVTPVNPQIATNTNQQFYAFGHYSDNSTQDITGSVTWSASTAIASIDPAGLATAGSAAGSTLITASVGAIAGSTQLTVSSSLPPQYVYTVEYGAILQFQVSPTGTLTPLSVPSQPTGAGPSCVTIDPTNSYVYLTNMSGDSIWAYSKTNGLLTPLNGTPMPTAQGAGPIDIAIHPSGQYAYVANALNNTVSQYSIVAHQFVPLSPAAVTVGTQPWSLTMDSTGSFLYVTNINSNTISQFAIVNGLLQPLNPATVPAGNLPRFMVIDPTGHFLYADSMGDHTVLQYSIGADGTLTPLVPAAVQAVQNSTISIAIDPTGHYLYALNESGGFSAGYPNSPFINQYSITNGQLTPLNPATLANPYTGTTAPWYITIDKTGKYVYTVDRLSGGILQYSINGGGELSPLTPAAIATGLFSDISRITTSY